VDFYNSDVVLQYCVLKERKDLDFALSHGIDYQGQTFGGLNKLIGTMKVQQEEIL